MPKRLVVFSHFDIDNIIDDYVIYYLERLKPIVSEIVFVSTSLLDDREKDKIAFLCSKIICRENIGYDFMSYKIGLLESGIQYRDYDEVVICNDSVYGPLFDLASVFEKMDLTRCDYWGITENRRIARHIQSYFYVFKSAVVHSDSFNAFFTGIETLHSKNEIIRNYEVGLTSLLNGKGYRFGVYTRNPGVLTRLTYCNRSMHNIVNGDRNRTSIASYARKLIRIIRNYAKRFNAYVVQNNKDPTLYYWEYSVKNQNPFFKIKLLRDKRFIIEPADSALDLLRERTDYPVELIVRHIERTGRKYN